MFTIQQAIFAALFVSALYFSQPTVSVSMDPPGNDTPPPSASR